MAEACSLRTTVAGVQRDLAAVGIADAAAEARRLVVSATGLPPETALGEPELKLGAAQQARVAEWLARRLRREPLARIVGSREFYGRPFALCEATLEPRDDTETLIDVALTLIDERRGRGHSWRIIDVGTGTGCLALTLLAELPHATALATDLSTQAIDMARANAEALAVADRCDWRRTSYLEGVAGPFDILVSNPPYVRQPELSALQPEVRIYDPVLALDGGSDGLAAYRAIAADLAGVVPRGLVLFEVAGDDHERVTETINDVAGRSNLCALGVWRDLTGLGRCVAYETLW